MEDEFYEWLLEARSEGCLTDLQIAEILTNDRTSMLWYDDFVDIPTWEKIEMVRRVTKKIQNQVV